MTMYSPVISSIGGEASTVTALGGCVRAVEALHAYEREVVGLPVWDMAFDDWLRDAEAARGLVIAAAGGISDLPFSGLACWRLRRMAGALAALMQAGDAESFAVAHGRLESTLDIGFASGRPEGLALVAGFRALSAAISKLIGLADYAPDWPGFDQQIVA